MEILTENVNNIAVVSLKGRLDINTHAQLETELNALAGKGQTKVLVDVKGLEYISSAGLRVLLSAAKTFKKINGVISLASLTPTVRQVFEISGFATIFPLYANREEALAKMK
ncbi:MAG TPA: STAS domain-containing protein [Opitutales bacterium]|nr:STAS domain-containing protein [Opitutales bacterium]